MKRYFKAACDIGFGEGHCYIEFDGDWASRQVEVYKERSFSSLDKDETYGLNLSDQPLSSSDMSEAEEISSREFEETWKKVTTKKG